MTPLRQAVESRQSLALSPTLRPGWTRSLLTRPVPARGPRPGFCSHGRFRRSSAISQFAAAAATEALGADLGRIQSGELRLGLVFCTMAGSVSYSRRFYEETLRDPATASPLIFPETVFNAPSSHLAALFKTAALNYTIVGDQSAFLLGLAVAANWLSQEQTDAALVVGSEELDWLVADAFHLFSRRLLLSEGAGALYLKPDQGGTPAVRLERITSAHPFFPGQSRCSAARLVRAELPGCCPTHLLCDGTQALSAYDAAEREAWLDWTGPRIAPKAILGESLVASAAWQSVVAVDQLQQQRFTAANVSVVGCNQQAIGAHFAQVDNP